MGKSPFDSVALLQKKERNWGSVICDRTTNDPKGTICTRVKEISNEYQEGTFISNKRTFYENNSEVSDGPQRKNAKQVASKKKSKKGESGAENASISKELSRKRTFVNKTQTTETTGSFYGVADCSDMETEVSDELKMKKAKQVASKKKSKEGESGVQNASISKEISSKIAFVDETQTNDTTGSRHGIADSGDMESVLPTGLDPGYGKCVYVRNLHLWPQFDPLGILRHISVFKPCRLSR